MKIVVIVPTYNEVENIGKMLDILVREVFPKIPQHSLQVLVVDDNSPDGTGKVVEKKMRQYNKPRHRVVNMLLGEKQGLGMAYARGMKHAMRQLSAEAVIELDADFQHDPKDVISLVSEFDKGYDYVIGSRYIKGGSIPSQWGAHRKFLSWGGNFFSRVVLLLFNVRDVTSGFKLSRVKGFLDHVNLDNLLSYDYAYKIHILYEMVKDRRARVREVPIKFYHRTHGSSKMETTDIRESLKVVIRLFFRSRFFKFGIVGVIGFAINAIMLEVFSNFPLFEQLAKTAEGISNIFPPVAQPSAWAGAAATEVAIISNFMLNNFWTFSKEKIVEHKKIVRKFGQFNLTSAGALIIQFIVIGTGTLLFGNTRLVRQLSLVVGVAVFVVPYNYTMYNIFIWKRWRVSWLPWLYRTPKEKEWASPLE